MRSLISFNSKNENDINTEIINNNNIKNHAHIIDKSKHFDRDKNKLIKLKLFLWPNNRLEDLACINRYWFYTILCIIGNANFKRALYDLGTSISVMPKHVYNSLSLELLIKTRTVIQFANHSFVYLHGVIKDVLVTIDCLVIICDFYILNMKHDSSNTNTSIVFGRLFLKTANTKINYGKDTLSMEVGDEVIEFSFHDAIKYPYSNVYSITCYDQINKYVQRVLDFDCEDGLSVALNTIFFVQQRV